eukprot:scaffold9021_cov118-Isochrysis_galbana.AAC.11
MEEKGSGAPSATSTSENFPLSSGAVSKDPRAAGSSRPCTSVVGRRARRVDGQIVCRRAWRSQDDIVVRARLVHGAGVGAARPAVLPGEAQDVTAARRGGDRGHRGVEVEGGAAPTQQSLNQPRVATEDPVRSLGAPGREGRDRSEAAQRTGRSPRLAISLYRLEGLAPLLHAIQPGEVGDELPAAVREPFQIAQTETARHPVHGLCGECRLGEDWRALAAEHEQPRSALRGRRAADRLQTERSSGRSHVVVLLNIHGGSHVDGEIGRLAKCRRVQCSTTTACAGLVNIYADPTLIGEAAQKVREKRTGNARADDSDPEPRHGGASAAAAAPADTDAADADAAVRANSAVQCPTGRRRPPTAQNRNMNE